MIYIVNRNLHHFFTFTANRVSDDEAMDAERDGNNTAEAVIVETGQSCSRFT